jgi:uncharacterized protein (TIGR04255 family)
MTQLKADMITISGLMGAPPEAAQQRQSGWRFTDGREDQARWQVSVLPDSASVETQRFDTWADMESRLRGLLEILRDTANPTIELRLGLRFVNVLSPSSPPTTDSTPPGSWTSVLSPVLLGPISDAELAEGIIATDHRWTIETDDGDMVTVRGALIDSGGGPSSGYLLDIDSWRQPEQPFDVANIIQGARALNGKAVSVFQRMVTPETLAAMKKEPDAHTEPTSGAK